LTKEKKMPTVPHQQAFALGVDVSEFDGDVNWQQVLQGGMSFGFARATMGEGGNDATFAQNWENMGGVGITRGAYHFFHAEEDPIAQAEHFLNTVPLTRHDMPPVLDVERMQGQTAATVVNKSKLWLNAVEARSGRRPIVYTGLSFWNDLNTELLGPDGRHYPLWLARYTSAATTEPPFGWDEWTFWQFAAPDDGAPHIEVPGIPNLADVNRFNGSHEGLIQRFGLR
jgi:lysozyme